MGDQEMLQSHINIAIDNTPTATTNANPRSELPASVLPRFHAGYFRISLSCWSQVLLWKTLSQRANEALIPIHNIFHNQTLPSIAYLLLWWLSFCTLILLSCLYIFRIIFHFRLVKAEFFHYVGLNYLFAPWISWLLFIQSVPLERLNSFPYQISWWVFVLPVLILDVKTYGQWFTTEKRFLSMVANPASQMSVMGNFVGAWAAARMGWKETAFCIFTLGLTHYVVVFITLYQRLSGSSRFPVMLRPVFFLFVAAPSTGSLAWSSISGSFDMPCKFMFYLSLFLFTSLICRPTLFKKSMKKFNIAWWAYSFPVTFLALSAAEYAQQVRSFVADGIMLIPSVMSVFVFLGMLVVTALHTDRLLLENDPVSLSFTKTAVDHVNTLTEAK